MRIVVPDRAFRLMGVKATSATAHRRQWARKHPVSVPECGSWVCGMPRDGLLRARALWTTHPGCARQRISGPAASSPGSHCPRVMRSSRHSLPHEGRDCSRFASGQGCSGGPLPRSTSECRLPVLGSRRLCVAIHQRRYEPQERLMFGVQRPTAEKGADVDIRCLMNTLRMGLAGQKPLGLL
jgi:hypothetical protein